MATTPRGYPYPALADANNVPYDIQRIAEAIDADAQQIAADVADLAAAPTSTEVVPSSPWTAPFGAALALPRISVKNGIVRLHPGAVFRPTVLSVAAGTVQQAATLPAALIADGLVPATETFGTAIVFAGSSVPRPVYLVITPAGQIQFSPEVAVTFNGGGATNSIRIPSITWLEP